MHESRQYSILFPFCEDIKYKRLSEAACHDLWLDSLCRELTGDDKEQNFIMDIISNMTSDSHTALYRQKIFADILNLPALRRQMSELFDKIEFMRNFSTSHIMSDEKTGFWHLMHRLDELDDYIKCVEEMRECLSDSRIKSEGLLNLKKYLDELYEDSCFAEMKTDIAELKTKASNIQSVTLGINVNERFEAVSMGLVSVNNKPFKKSNIIGRFADAAASKNKLHDGTEWDGDMRYRQIDRNRIANSSPLETAGRYMVSPFLRGNTNSTVANIPDGDGTANATSYLDAVLNKMLSSMVKKLGDTLSKYADIAIVNISQLMPEFMYYIRFAEFIAKYKEKGFKFCEAQITDGESVSMNAKGIYNLKLAVNLLSPDEIVCNDLKFDAEHTIYILTGANRGGKTTVTQAVGLI